MVEGNEIQELTDPLNSESLVTNKEICMDEPLTETFFNKFVYCGLECVEWRSEVFQDTPLAIFYRLSPFLYSLVGLCIIVFFEQLQEYDVTFWWISFGFALFCQGFISYMADVYTWGEKSMWKTLDTYYAATLTFISCPVIIFRALVGYCNYPPALPILWSIFASWAIFCKFMSTRVLRLKMACKNYLLWHGLWHCLPGYATALILWLVIRKL
tara:strand:+ start:2863 stop:3501 length:639 start_codon:yes stop_codon:yes gene_type:complete